MCTNSGDDQFIWVEQKDKTSTDRGKNPERKIKQENESMKMCMGIIVVYIDSKKVEQLSFVKSNALYERKQPVVSLLHNQVEYNQGFCLSSFSVFRFFVDIKESRLSFTNKITYQYLVTNKFTIY